MYRPLGALGQDDDEPVVVPEEGPYAQPPSDPASVTVTSGGGGGNVNLNLGDFFSQFFRGFGFGVNVPNQGWPGTRGCAPSSCPVTQGALVACVPCSAPAGIPPFSAVAQQSWFLPVVVVGGLVVVLALSGRRR